MAEDEQDGYHVREDEAALEAERLALLAQARDPKSISVLERTGVAPGWHCLELGAGAGTLTSWMADRVGPSGTVLSTDIELRFHADAAPNTTVTQHDIATEELPGTYDLIHTRAVLQHVPARDEVVAKLSAALNPGGWLVLEDSSFAAFAGQKVPDAYQPLHDLVCSGATSEWRDPEYGLQLLDRMSSHGLTDLDAFGDAWAMRPGEPGGEWWFLALERAGVRLVEFEMMSQEQIDEAIAAVRAPGFVMMSPLSIAVIGRRPA